MTLHTRFTELVGCEVPIQLAPMFGVPTPDLVAAVNEGGGMGMFGAGPMPAAALSEELARMRARTQGPLGVNILLPAVAERDPADRAALVERAAAGATLVDFFHATPDAELVDLVHRHGTLAGWQVGSLEHARLAAAAGCDVIVVRGVEGGGRMHGSESLWPLLAEVLAAVDVPVLAAGGIGDARGLAAALAAGAAGVRMGTRFLAAAESGAHPTYRAAVIAASASDTVLTDEFRAGWPDPQSSSRVLRSSLQAARGFDGDVVGHLRMGAVSVPVPTFGLAMPLRESTGAIEAMAMYAGESVRFVHRSEPAAQIVRQLADGAEALLRAWC